MKKINNKKQKRISYYAILNKNDNFLHGVFPPSKEGLLKAKAYISKIDPTNRNYKIKEY